MYKWYAYSNYMKFSTEQCKSFAKIIQVIIVNLAKIDKGIMICVFLEIPTLINSIAFIDNKIKLQIILVISYNLSMSEQKM